MSPACQQNTKMFLIAVIASAAVWTLGKSTRLSADNVISLDLLATAPLVDRASVELNYEALFHCCFFICRFKKFDFLNFM